MLIEEGKSLLSKKELKLSSIMMMFQELKVELEATKHM